MAVAWLLAAAPPADARTLTELLSGADAPGTPQTVDALSTKLDLATTPELNISVAGGWSAADQSAWDLKRQLFLRGDARVELADGRWLETLYAGYTDQQQEKRASDDAGLVDVVQLQGTSRLLVGALQELRLSPTHSVALRIQALNETNESGQRIHLGLRSEPEIGAGWSLAERRTQSALIEDRIQLGRGRLELGGAFEKQTAETGRMLARAAGDYVTRSGIQVLASVGLGFADPSRLQTSLTAATASGAPLGPSGARRAAPRSWQLRASRGFAAGKLTLGASVAQAQAQGSLDRFGDMTAHLELASSDPYLRPRAQRLESFVAFAPLAATRLELAYMATAARLASARSDDLAVARQAVRANLTWTPLPTSSFGLALRYVGRRREDDPSSALAPRVGATQGSYGACDLSVRHAFGTRWRMVAQVESIVHRDREPGSSPPPPRVRGTVGLEGAF